MLQHVIVRGIERRDIFLDNNDRRLGTVLGPLVGAFTVVTLQSELSSVGSWITVIIGSIFVICVLLFRRGFIGELGRLLKRSL